MPSFVDVGVALVWIATRNDELTSNVRRHPKRDRAVERALASAGASRRDVWRKLVEACAAGHVRASGTLIQADGSIVPRTAILPELWRTSHIDEEGDYILLRDRHRWQALRFDAEGLRRHFPPEQPVPEGGQASTQSKVPRPKRPKRLETAIIELVFERWKGGKIPPISAKKRKEIIEAGLKAKDIAQCVSDRTIQRALGRIREIRSGRYDRI